MSLSLIVLESIPPAMRKLRKLTRFSLNDVTLQQVRTLVYIKEGMGQAQIAETLEISPAAVSKTLSGLVDKKMVKKEPGKDGRSTTLLLTAKGMKALNSVRSQVTKRLDEGLKHLNETEKKELERGLSVLNKLMEFVY